MADVVALDPDHDPAEVLAILQRDGAVVLRDMLDAATLDGLGGELGPWIDATPEGRDRFSGLQTSRTGALVARSQTCRSIVMHPLVVDLAERFLAPFTNRIQLHLTQVITIRPGQPSQPLHRDRLAWGGYVPRSIEPQFNTMWALTDFTEANGATRVVPGSVDWPDDRRAEDHEKAQATMAAGSVLLYTGSVIHGGGANQSDHARVGMNITYCLGWLRTEENQFLSCPPEVAATLDPPLQEMLGYTMGNYALGYYSDPAAILDGATDILAPERALGRRPRPEIAAGMSGS